MDKAKELRRLLSGNKIVPVPGVYDAVTAKVAEYCKFECVYMTGYGTAASFGFSDIGLLTMTEMLDNLRRINDAIEIPLLVDADTGYGTEINVYRTVKEYEKAGAAAIQLEDQKWPKRCGHMQGKQVIEAEEMVGKIRAAVDARVNPDIVLIIRTDAIATDGLDAAISRANLYVEAGADLLFVEAPTSIEQMRQIPPLLSKPCLINMGLPQPGLDTTVLQEMGYRVALYPTLALIGTIEGCMKSCKSLLSEGTIEEVDKWPFDFEGLNRFLGSATYRSAENNAASSSCKGQRDE